MRANKQLLLALLMAVVSSVIVLGSLSLSLFESGYTLVEGQAGTPLSLIPGEMLVTLFAPRGGGSVGFETIVPATGEFVGQIVAPTPTIPGCQHPEGWQIITISLDDTLKSLAHTYNANVALLKQANCLVIDQLVAGTDLSVPPLPAGQVAATRARAAACTPPSGWIAYTVRPGDNLYNLGYRLGYSAYQIQSSNCLNSSYIYTGQVLRLPYYPPAWLPTATLGPVVTVWVPSPTWRIPTTTPIILPVPSLTPTWTLPPVWTATNTAVPSATHTDVPTPSNTPVTPEPTSTNTPVTPPATFTSTPAPSLPTSTEAAPVIINPPTSTSVPAAPPTALPPVIVGPPTPTSGPVGPAPVPPPAQPTLPPGTVPIP